MAPAAGETAKEAAPQRPKSLLLEPPMEKVLVCGRRLEPPPLSYVVNFPRLTVVLSGCHENLIEANNRAVTVRLTRGMALFAPPTCWNLPSWRHPVRLLALLFGEERIGISLVTYTGGTRPRLITRKFSLPRPLTGPLPMLLDAMLELQAAGGPASALRELASALLCCVRGAIRQPAPERVSAARSLLEEVCLFLRTNYQGDISRDSVARQFAVSPNYLSRVFQAQGKMTFTSYLRHVRVDRAKHLLRSYRLKLDDIAARCGYRDTAYFCRVFKHVARTTPAGYRAVCRPLLDTKIP